MCVPEIGKVIQIQIHTQFFLASVLLLLRELAHFCSTRNSSSFPLWQYTMQAPLYHFHQIDSCSFIRFMAPHLGLLPGACCRCLTLEHIPFNLRWHFVKLFHLQRDTHTFLRLHVASMCKISQSTPLPYYWFSGPVINWSGNVRCLCSKSVCHRWPHEHCWFNLAPSPPSLSAERFSGECPTLKIKYVNNHS